MNSLSLIIDTSIHGAAVGLFNKSTKELVFSDISNDVIDSARQLPLMVQRGLQEISANESQIESLVVSQGPGSFTGIRVGLAYTYGFLFGLRCNFEAAPQILGVSSFGVLAESLAKQANADIVLFLPATKVSGYAAIVKGGVCKMIAVDLALEGFADSWPKNWVVLGEWLLLEAVAKSTSASITKSIASKDAAKAALISMVGMLRDDSKLTWATDLPEAIYLRKSSVEEKSNQSK